MINHVYEEIKDLALKFPQSISKEDFIQIIGHISSDVILTHQLNNALAAAHDLADFKVTIESLKRDLQNNCEKVYELELSLDETQEKYNNVLRNSNNEALQKYLALLEQLINEQRILVEQNSSLKKEIALNERNLLARNERIQALEPLLQDAQEKLTTQNQKFEAQLQASISLGRIFKSLHGGIPVSDRELAQVWNPRRSLHLILIDVICRNSTSIQVLSLSVFYSVF
ncbi:kinesin heavy chain [Rhizophagus irregularis DAOM 181602=DAOM 197198]|nr:kinesin heavy chain [Rhizophagus irregularis DAOM 181602=DAOM 197198]